jgi:Mg2+/Co2+ transporter CorC
MKHQKKAEKPRSLWEKWLRSTIDTSVLNRDELLVELRQTQKNNSISMDS